jgi:hypothetical protein
MEAKLSQCLERGITLPRKVSLMLESLTLHMQGAGDTGVTTARLDIRRKISCPYGKEHTDRTGRTLID